jgi:hypothetical protein
VIQAKEKGHLAENQFVHLAENQLENQFVSNVQTVVRPHRNFDVNFRVA